MKPIEKILAALGDRVVASRGDRYEVRCPAHDDGRASLGVAETQDGTVLMKCLAGCNTNDVLGAIGLTAKDLFVPRNDGPGGRIVKEYDYTDTKGRMLYQVVRLDPKGFRQRRQVHGAWSWTVKGLKKVIYNLPAVVNAPADATILVVEGEKSADLLKERCFVATCSPGGAGKWRNSYSEYLRDRKVAILADNDEPGRAHAGQVARSLIGIAAEVKIVELPGLTEKADVYDWLTALGHSPDELVEAIAATGQYGPAATPVVVAGPGPVATPSTPSAPAIDATGLLMESLGLVVMGANDDRSFTLCCDSTGNRMTFRNMRDVSYAEMLRLAGENFASKVAPDQYSADQTKKTSLSDFQQTLALFVGRSKTTTSGILGDGIYRLPLPEDFDDTRIYLVHNGRFYLLDGAKLVMDRSPVVRGHMIDATAAEARYDISLLNEALGHASDPKVRQEAYQELLGAVSLWRWDHPLMTDLATSLLCATWIQTLWDWRPVVMLVGESHSGKSAWLKMAKSLFLNSASMPAGVTEPGVRQTVRMGAMPLLIDEFDRCRQQERVMDLLRTTAQRQEKVVGTSGQRAVRSKLQHIPWLLGIYDTAREHADRNRTIDLAIRKGTTDTLGGLPTPGRARAGTESGGTGRP